jgi:hypothetical protein
MRASCFQCGNEQRITVKAMIDYDEKNYKGYFCNIGCFQRFLEKEKVSPQPLSSKKQEVMISTTSIASGAMILECQRKLGIYAFRA